jgi:hypothetical protein
LERRMGCRGGDGDGGARAFYSGVGVVKHA